MTVTYPVESTTIDLAGTAWVDATNGLNATAVLGSPATPYQTLQAAITAGASTVFLSEGSYSSSVTSGSVLRLFGAGYQGTTISLTCAGSATIHDLGNQSCYLTIAFPGGGSTLTLRDVKANTIVGETLDTIGSNIVLIGACSVASISVNGLVTDLGDDIGATGIAGGSVTATDGRFVIGAISANGTQGYDGDGTTPGGIGGAGGSTNLAFATVTSISVNPGLAGEDNGSGNLVTGSAGTIIAAFCEIGSYSSTNGAPSITRYLSKIAGSVGGLNQFAATTSAELATVLSDDVGNTGGFTRAGYFGSAALVASSTFQTASTVLSVLAALTPAVNKGIQFTSSTTASTYDLTTAGKALLDDADASAQRITLGLGTASTQTIATFLQTANNLSDVTAATARTNLGLGTMALAATSSYLALIGGTLTGRIDFSGTSHVGVRLNSLTTTQWNAITKSNGDTAYDSTLNRVVNYLNGGTVQQIDSSGGQTISGSLLISKAGPGGSTESYRLSMIDPTYSRTVGFFFADDGTQGGVKASSQIYLKAGSGIYIAPNGLSYGLVITSTGNKVQFTNTTETLELYASAAGYSPLTLKAAASQTAHILDCKNSAGTTLTAITAAGNLSLLTAGGFIQYKSGTGQRAGNATLVSGTVTVSNTTVTANTIVMLTRKTSGGTIGTSITYTLSAGASFTITSDNILDTSVFSYELLELV